MSTVLWVTLLISVSAQAYHYILYPVLVWLLPKHRRTTQAESGDRPSVCVIVCAYNEAGIIAEKIGNTVALDPAPSRMLLVADGSDDGTENVARAAQSGDVQIDVLYEPTRRGKANAMNRAAAHVSDDIMCFTDANAMLSEDAVEELLKEFEAPSVAIVSGSKHVFADPNSASSVSAGDGVYWRWETFLREQESRCGTTVATVGELFAVRRDLWEDIPPGVINDDAWITMRMLTKGFDVRFARKAESWEAAAPNTAAEVERRRRINSGRIRMLFLKGVWPLRRPFALLAFISHKVLRLFLPFLFAMSFASSAALAVMSDSWFSFEMMVALAHVAFVFMAGLHHPLRSAGVRWRPASAAFHILSSYFAVILAVFDSLGRQDHVLWSKPSR